MSDANTQDGYEPVEMTYAGRRETAKGEVFIVFYHGDEDASFDSPKTVRRFRTAVIGGVYTHHRKDRSFQLSDKFVRPANDERIAEWKAADEAVDVAIRARKRIADARSHGKDSLLAVLEPFRTEYAKTDHIGRLALEVVLLNALRRS